MRLSRTLLAACLLASASVNQAFAQNIDVCLTTMDRTSLVELMPGKLSFSDKIGGKENLIIVDDQQAFQSVEGFGFALTGGSAQHLMSMTKEVRMQTLRQLFGREPGQAGINFIRLTLGASDMNAFVFSYDDMPEGKEDFKLKHFSLAQDLKDVVPVMQEILSIAPDITVMSSPWSAPAWMKESKNVRGGKLRKECYDVYAEYFVKYVQAMKEKGITIHQLTIQNEPLNSRNTPSMPWSPQDEAEFIGKFLGPKLEAAGLDTKIILFDHNCDRPDYPLTTLLDHDADKYTHGIAYHHYAGDMSAMTYTHMVRPDKGIYFTEQMTTERPGSPEIAIARSAKRLIVDIMRNWSRNVTLWNLAADSLNDPHTDNGGCSMCQGAITIDNGKLTSLNIAYYVVAQIAQFVPIGSVRIASTAPDDPALNLYEDEQNPGIFRLVHSPRANVLPNVAFKTPEGKTVLLVVNDRAERSMVKIQYNGKYAMSALEAGAVATYIW